MQKNPIILDRNIDMNIIKNAPATAIFYRPENDIKAVQILLNRISYNFPCIPKIYPINGKMTRTTENAIITFKEIFSLNADSTIDNETAQMLICIYFGIIKYSNSEDIETNPYPGFVLKEGAVNNHIKILQEHLSYIGMTFNNIPAVTGTGYFGPMTKNSVVAFQKQFNFPPNGMVGELTWNKISGVYSDLFLGFHKKIGQFPGYILREE